MSGRKLPAGIHGDAEFIDQGRRRIWLSRTWLPNYPNLGGYWLWIGMNPSVANGTEDDPTVAKEVVITKRCGGNGYVKCNVLDWIETDSTKLSRIGHHLCSNSNLETIDRFAAKADCIVCAWGNLPKKLQFHADYLVSTLHKYELWCLGTNNNGNPKHPLYMKNDSLIQKFRSLTKSYV